MEAVRFAHLPIAGPNPAVNRTRRFMASAWRASLRRLPFSLGRYHMLATLREANRVDVAEMHRVRVAVRENRLTTSAITEEHYIPAIEATGRGWVVEVNGAVVAFAIGNGQTGNIWALFVHPDHECCGYGRRLHDVMVSWLFSRGLTKLWLSTTPNTRAEHFYAAAGWQFKCNLPSGESMYELQIPKAP